MLLVLLHPHLLLHHNNYRYSFGCLIACVFNRSVVPYPYLDERMVMAEVCVCISQLYWLSTVRELF